MLFMCLFSGGKSRISYSSSQTTREEPDLSDKAHHANGNAFWNHRIYFLSKPFLMHFTSRMQISEISVLKITTWTYPEEENRLKKIHVTHN